MQRLLGRRVQADHRLVEQDQQERPDQRAGKLGLLSHPAGQLSREEVTSGGQAEQLQQVVDAPVDSVAHPMGQRDQLQVLADGQIGIEQWVVRHEGERSPRTVKPQAVAGDRHLPVGRLEQARDQPQGGRLARAVLADQSDALTGLDLQVEQVDRDQLAVGLADPT